MILEIFSLILLRYIMFRNICYVFPIIVTCFLSTRIICFLIIFINCFLFDITNNVFIQKPSIYHIYCLLTKKGAFYNIFHVCLNYYYFSFICFHFNKMFSFLFFTKGENERRWESSQWIRVLSTFISFYDSSLGVFSFFYFAKLLAFILFIKYNILSIQCEFL